MVALLAQAPMPSTDRSGSAPLPPQEPAETDAPAPALQLAATGTEATERKIASAPRLAAEPLVTPAQDQATPASVPVETRAPAPAPSAPSPSAAPAQQDLAALIDRIVEARAAAAPQTVRASLVHEEFGSVSLNFRSEQAHIHVTLGSADPGFAPAVQAAAAATLSAETRGEPDRRDHSAQQQPGPETAAHGNPSSPQNGAQERPSTEGRAAARKHGFEQPASRSSDNTPTHPAPHRRSGIYA